VVLNSVSDTQSEPGDEDCDQEISMRNSIEDKRASLGVAVMEEAEHRTNSIWRKVLEIRRGKGIKGEEILCLYILPSTIGNKKINLSDFGSSSTVSDVKKDVMTILNDFLHLEDMNNCNDKTNLPVVEIQKEIIRNINQRCSENGYETGL
jgi:hypothetical protein